MQIQPEEPSRESLERRWRLLHRLDRRRSLAVAVVVGVVAALFAIAFQIAVKWTETLGHGLSQWPAKYGAIAILGLVLVGAATGALSGWVTDRFAKEAAGSGIPHVKAVLMGLRVLKPFQILWVKWVGGITALISGMSLGREGPTVHMGAVAGDVVGKTLKVPSRSRRHLVAAGAGAGLAAAFNAPLAGFLFVMEELRREMSPMTYGTALAASVSSVATMRYVLGQESSFRLPMLDPLPLRQILALVVVGVVVGGIGALFNVLVMRTTKMRSKLKMPRWVAGGIVGIAASLLLWLFPAITGGGHSLAQEVLQGSYDMADPIRLGLLLLVGKLLFSVASYATGTPGGIFAPMLAIGSVGGLVTGQLGNQMFPGLGLQAEPLATVGMAAMLSASIRAPLTSVVLIVEMTGQYNLLFALLFASFVANAFAEFVHCEGIYESLLRQDLAGKDFEDSHDGEVVEVFVEPRSPYSGKRLKALDLPQGVVVACIERQGQVLAPRGNTTLRAGDHLTIILGAGHTRKDLLPFVEGTSSP